MSDYKPVIGRPSDPIAVQEQPNRPDPVRPATANPEQIEHYFKVPASDPARAPNDPLSRAGRMKP
ncbi:MAG: hypothetical protein JXP73_03255 [Deltaproteobacteria bacterium]|nr:hypothetical protein [Deltaproteobacteria bacterium]